MKHPTIPLCNFKTVFSIGLILIFAKIACAELFPLPSRIKAEADTCGTQTQAAIDQHKHGTLDAKKCPLSATFLQWLQYTSSGGSVTFQEVAKFIDQHHDWPSQKPLQRRAEEALRDGDEAFAKTWFKKHPPLTGKGWVYYGRTLPKKTKKTLIAKAWKENIFTHDGQALFLKEFKDLLTPEDHFHRAEFLLLQNKPDLLPSLFSLMNSKQLNFIKNCAAADNKKKNPQSLLMDLPHTYRESACVLQEQVRWHTTQKENDEAIALIRKLPSHMNPDYHQALWRDRNLITRRLIEEKKYNKAYQLIRHHGLIKGDGFATGEWLAGWLALRYLKKPHAAHAHFVKLYNHVQSPISKARAAFWAGEAETAMHRKDAKLWYQRATTFPTTFYGQLAASRLKSNPPPIAFRLPAKNGPALVKFKSRPEVQIIQLLHALKRTNHIDPFLVSLTFEVKDPKEQELLVEFAAEHGSTYTGVWVTIQSTKTQVPLVPSAFPLLKTASKNRLSPLIHALIRQESRFNAKAESSKGAQGMMQLRPQTAREVERNFRIKSRSLMDRDHNIQVGEKFVEELLQNFSGNLILVTAAYNAGSGKVSQWIKDFGDPRDPTVDPIEWIELIPYGETRNYVQRVIETYLVYRARLDLPPLDIMKILQGERIDI